jgi:putative alpha-1,2-mannosidase
MAIKVISVLGILIYGVLSLNTQSEANEKDLAKYVDPFWGVAEPPWTGGHTFAGAAMPHGMVKLGPDCNKKITNSGYDREGKIYGFSHVHTTGSGGNPKYGNVLVMATSGEIYTNEYASNKVNETARPGYFGAETVIA